MTDDHWLSRAVELAVENVAAGGGPFGAVIVHDGTLVAEGQNRVTRDLDPTAHAEVSAIRRACASLRVFSLVGCVLYTSCEPCPLCLTASLWARLDRVVARRPGTVEAPQVAVPGLGLQPFLVSRRETTGPRRSAGSRSSRDLSRRWPAPPGPGRPPRERARRAGRSRGPGGSRTARSRRG
ncbi:nucleoside deaminase [Nocardioides sp. T2.26MG-1]|uniref:nucleoside deaminase n=1 Tax=Nocardioides sp. T2.26MG-1 TaxID=3041166 RepID=UPI002540C719|nr:nucleoside deaminase [Nocardioides sp. T2.26MG-1]